MKSVIVAIGIAFYLLLTIARAISEAVGEGGDGDAEFDAALTRVMASADLARYFGKSADSSSRRKTVSPPALPYQILSRETLVRLVAGPFAAYSIQTERSLRRYTRGPSRFVLLLGNALRATSALVALGMLFELSLVTELLQNLVSELIQEQWVFVGLLMSLAILILGIPVSVYRFLEFRSRRNAFLACMRSLLESLKLPRKLLREIGQNIVATKNEDLFDSLYARPE